MRLGLCIVMIGIMLPHISAQDVLRVYRGDNNSLRTNLTVQPGFTVYTLTQALGVSQGDFVANNPGSSTLGLELNTSISLRVNPSKISISHLGLEHPIEVRYVVSSKETLYSIARVFAQKEVSEILLLNKKENNNLSINESLILGYIDWPYVDYQPALAEQETLAVDSQHISVLSDVDQLARSIAIAQLPIPLPFDQDIEALNKPIQLTNHIMITKGIAFCERGGGGTEELVVMHPTAKVDSKIELYNPMLKRTVAATVISSPPENSYPDDISVVISPSVADALGALDRRFLVEMTFIAAN